MQQSWNLIGVQSTKDFVKSYKKKVPIFEAQRSRDKFRWGSFRYGTKIWRNTERWLAAQFFKQYC